ncbi:MAG TPA: nucleotide exchange factor GrpE [Candidatus Saccharimonadales bacterium]|nr:nucleotide exchange factor GrpE [Candidatus Saccharimonadales bacterium]
MEEIKKGIYRHYKGGEYRILNEVVNSETQEEMVVYQDIKDESKIWVRPKQLFLGEVEIKGKKKLRFEFLSAEENADESLEYQYKRALADYHNLLKQTAKDKQDFAKYALQDFLQEILPVYDHLKLSLSGLTEEDNNNPWAVGVRHVLKQFRDVLESKGVMEIKTVGEKFDHNTMEAMDGTGEIVDKEIMPGYQLNGRVIRPAKVIVK